MVLADKPTSFTRPQMRVFQPFSMFLSSCFCWSVLALSVHVLPVSGSLTSQVSSSIFFGFAPSVQKHASGVCVVSGGLPLYAPLFGSSSPDGDGYTMPGFTVMRYLSQSAQDHVQLFSSYFRSGGMATLPMDSPAGRGWAGHW